METQSSFFRKIVENFGTPDIDLFATRINTQLDVSWHPEPEAMAIDAFSLTWNNNFFYIFPPFSLVGLILANIQRNKTNVVTVVPDWSTQDWYLQ